VPNTQESAARAMQAAAPPPQYDPRAILVQVVYVLNIASFVGSGIGLMFFPQDLAPGVNTEGRMMVRAFGALSLCYGWLYSALGKDNHAAYCLTFTFHFCVALLSAYEHTVVLPNGSHKDRVFYVGAGHLSAFTVMIALLITGKVSDESKRKRRD
jgi:hypothetical protein